jgi:hypothetical protein
MFNDDGDFSRFRTKPRNASRRVTISSHVGHADLGVETSAGSLRLHITTSVVVEIDDDSLSFDEFSSQPEARPTRRLPTRSKR